MAHTFRGGVHPAAHKSYTADKPLRNAKVPQRAILPLVQHTGAPCKPLVKAGDTVSAGQMIAGAEAFISSPIHASISGTIKAIDELPHPVCGRCAAIVIEGDGKDGLDAAFPQRRDAETLGKEEIRAAVLDAGLVGLGGAAFPTHVKLNTDKKKADAAILNGAECEPYLTCDSRLMIEEPERIIKGLFVILRAIDARDGYIAVEDNEPEAVSALETALEKIRGEKGGDGRSVKLFTLHTKYPQGSEKQIIDAVLKRRVPPGGLPLDVGCIVQNVGTAIAVHDAVTRGLPLIERCLTVTGDCVKEPANLRVRIGTPVRDLIDECGGFVKEPAKVIMGGPMMGISQCTLDIPVIKGTGGIVALSKERAVDTDELPCISCGRCVDACPMELLPLQYAKFVKREKWNAAREHNITDCMECGSCTYMCPSRIPLIQYIKRGKIELLLRKGK